MKECSKCKSNEYTNKSLVMLINECAHPLCRNCVDNLYARNAAPCHICGRILRKNTFWEQVFDDPLIEKENNIRKRLRKIYNLKADEFPTLRDFNDYLEQFEIIVCNLANDVEVDETERMIHEFKEANAELIERNRRRLDDDQLWVQEQLQQEKEQKKRLHDVLMAEQTAASDRVAAQRDTKAIMEEIRHSGVPAEQILDRERKRQIEAELEQKEESERKKRLMKDTTRKRNADQISFSIGTRRGIEPTFSYVPPVLPMNGPDMPSMGTVLYLYRLPYTHSLQYTYGLFLDDLESLGYLEHMRAPRPDALAGGYVAALGAARALLEARVDLLAF